MKLSEYPEAIYKQQLKLNHWLQQIEIQAERLAFMDADIEAAIATDKELKNDQQRKARRFELQQEPDYLAAKVKLTEAKAKRDLEEIYLAKLRNEFSVAKLEARLEAARLEAVA